MVRPARQQGRVPRPDGAAGAQSHLAARGRRADEPTPVRRAHNGRQPDLEHRVRDGRLHPRGELAHRRAVRGDRLEGGARGGRAGCGRVRREATVPAQAGRGPGSPLREPHRADPGDRRRRRHRADSCGPPRTGRAADAARPPPVASPIVGTIGRTARMGAGLALGAATAAAHVLLLLPAAIALLVPAARPAVATVPGRLAGIERTRVTTTLGGIDTAAAAPSAPRALRYLGARLPVAFLGGIVITLLVVGVGFAITLLWSWISGTPWILDGPSATVVTGEIVLYYAASGVVLLYLGMAGAAVVVRWERALLARLLAPSREEQLTRRVAELAGTRDAVVAAVDDERRRIERDLHDGVQQRLVALGMLLGRARRHPDRAAELVAQAHEEAQRALVELRDVSWRGYPGALDTEGPAAALESVAERAPLPGGGTCPLTTRPPPALRAAAWFVACEAVTNAAKHSGATSVTIEVGTMASALHVNIRDDGCGGANPAGIGLAGLARRVAAVDGELTVESPPGAGTLISAHLPVAEPLQALLPGRTA